MAVRTVYSFEKNVHLALNHSSLSMQFYDVTSLCGSPFYVVAHICDTVRQCLSMSTPFIKRSLATKCRHWLRAPLGSDASAERLHETRKGKVQQRAGGRQA